VRVDPASGRVSDDGSSSRDETPAGHPPRSPAAGENEKLTGREQPPTTPSLEGKLNRLLPVQCSAHVVIVRIGVFVEVPSVMGAARAAALSREWIHEPYP